MLFWRKLRGLMIFNAVALLVGVVFLTASGLQGVWKFRVLTKSIRERATQLPLNMELVRQIGELRVALHQHRGSTSRALGPSPAGDLLGTRDQFSTHLAEVRLAVEAYRQELETAEVINPKINDSAEELEDLCQIEVGLHSIEHQIESSDWVLGDSSFSMLDDQLASLQDIVARIPTRTKQRLDQFSEEARRDYHFLYYLSSILPAVGVAMIVMIAWSFHVSLLRPLRVLFEGARRVSHGQYDHVVELRKAPVELNVLAHGLNAMTRHFRETRDDLDRQVRERSNEVIRNEQLASVGFLAAGVAHEINNPLATIAWSAESLEGRTMELIGESAWAEDDPRREELTVIRRYLRRIQDEAFRVKGITDGLLDFSRLGSTRKVETDVRELVDSVVDLVRHLGRHRGKDVQIEGPARLNAVLCPQSIKQVVLNLVTNSLDSVDAHGKVTISLEDQGDQVALIVTDNGCGMTEETLEHVFEPFFTLKRDQQGTGLGLAITHRIVSDHQGTIVPRSDGPAQGSTFTVTLPKQPHAKANEVRPQAA
ncbi:MAG: HAMP domain-containing sensor histidine kinase [Pirellulaceae bacterium]|nr:HAMP domain-containing histidine kinase [Planctomycetales bacterium]